MRFKTVFSLALMLCAACTLFAHADNRGTVEAIINSKKVSINYGRPSMKGRDLLSLAPVGMVWRLGMNEATEIESTGNLIVAGKELKAGKYSLWVKKTGEDSWILAFHPKTGIWGRPALTEGYVAELPLKLEKTPESVEQLTINLAAENGEAVIRIHWGTSVLVGSFGVK